MHLICRVTSHKHLIEGSCEFMVGKSLPNVITLISPVIKVILIVEICFEFVT